MAFLDKNKEREYKLLWYHQNKHKLDRLKLKKYNKKWYEEHKDYSSKWKQAHKKSVKESKYKTKYGITLAQKEQLLKEQDFKCKICGTTDPGSQGWHTDHKKGTKIVRGILCRFCNVGLGQFRDDPKLLLNACNYLNQWI